MSWRELIALIAAASPVASTGRPPFAHETMLRIHFLQQWFGLSDLAMEEALFETPLYRDFTGLTGTERIPDRVGILRFRRLLEEHQLSLQILATVNSTLASNGLLLKSGTAIEATLIAVPSSTKNSTGERAGDAPDKEGEPVALRDESTYWCRYRLGSGAHGGGHGHQGQRRYAGPRGDAR